MWQQETNRISTAGEKISQQIEITNEKKTETTEAWAGDRSAG